MSEAKFRVSGLCAAPYTPFLDNDERSIDFEGIDAHVEELIRQGVFYAFVCGTTGEGVTMSVEERQSVLERWIKTSAGRVKIIAHVGAESITDMLTLTKHAEKAGSDAIAVMPTTFNKPVSIPVIVELLSLISRAAPATPLYYYHISIKTGVNIRCDKLLEKLHENRTVVPTFRGIKYTDFDMHIYANCVAFAGGEYDILSGRDEVLLAALAMGGRGAVGSTYNYCGRIYNAMIKAFLAGDMVKALEYQRMSQQSIDILLSDKYGSGVNIGKAIMEQRLGGKHTGPPRYPGQPMAEDRKALLKADLDVLKFFEW